MSNENKIKTLTLRLEELYTKESKKLIFHGWHHVVFVKTKALDFAVSIHADVFLVESAALVHDLNYIIKAFSEPEEAKEYRHDLLSEIGYTESEIERIESIIMESHTAIRNHTISNEWKALSDADTLFKALPITPILFTSNYIQQNQIDIQKLASKITSEQNKLLNEWIYFYTDLAKSKYLKRAEVNLALWNNVYESLKDKDITDMLDNAKKMWVL
ncbi:MAG: hypothetical protein ACD_80C00057G0003 [uncultured bacterium (gcode 4)]|uniref:HD domain-containing protein n=1 Tax=uncultured bacterium (gcode 4) TaxID=1234023 RepID=K1X5F7_9BACT|nr:MAG: hypothetical protein ACD_80C00057G0003 [uncultured bacterium (gcode 4)]